MELDKLVRFAVCFLCVMSSKAFSAGVESFHVDFIGCQLDGVCLIGVEPEVTVSSCPNGAQLRFNISEPGASAIYSAVLAAFSSSKEVRVDVSDQCISSFPVPVWLHVNNDSRVE